MHVMQVMIVIGGEVSLSVPPPRAANGHAQLRTARGHSQPLHIVDLAHLDWLAGAALTGQAEACGATAKTAARVLCVGAYAFKNFQREEVRPFGSMQMWLACVPDMLHLRGRRYTSAFAPCPPVACTCLSL
jgi:hypothetical protein